MIQESQAWLPSLRRQSLTAVLGASRAEAELQGRLGSEAWGIQERRARRVVQTCGQGQLGALVSLRMLGNMIGRVEVRLQQ